MNSSYSSLFQWVIIAFLLGQKLIDYRFEINKEVLFRKLEFKKVNLDKCLPLLEELNTCISEYSMMFFSYRSAICNSCSLPEDLEQKRLEQDGKILELIHSVSIYLPDEFRRLLFQIRKVISCSWHPEPNIRNRALKEIGISLQECMNVLGDLYQDLVDCFYDMCSEYVRLSNKNANYSKILKIHSLNKYAKTTKKDVVSQYALKAFLLHEYYGSNEIIDAEFTLMKHFGVTP